MSIRSSKMTSLHIVHLSLGMYSNTTPQTWKRSVDKVSAITNMKTTWSWLLLPYFHSVFGTIDKIRYYHGIVLYIAVVFGFDQLLDVPLLELSFAVSYWSNSILAITILAITILVSVWWITTTMERMILTIDEYTNLYFLLLCFILFMYFLIFSSASRLSKMTLLHIVQPSLGMSMTQTWNRSVHKVSAITILVLHEDDEKGIFLRGRLGSRVKKLTRGFRRESQMKRNRD